MCVNDQKGLILGMIGKRDGAQASPAPPPADAS